MNAFVGFLLFDSMNIGSWGGFLVGLVVMLSTFLLMLFIGWALDKLTSTGGKKGK